LVLYDGMKFCMAGTISWCCHCVQHLFTPLITHTNFDPGRYLKVF
jgi:hypothetical protein